eukprot:COSAG02_NODE_5024_length_4719_cov_13.040693_2_plen_93_part_00
MGVSQDTFLVEAFKQARTLRLADGPDEVHWRTAGRLEMTMQQSRETPLGRLGDYGEANRAQWRMQPFRRSTDTISAEAAEKTVYMVGGEARL